MLWACYDYWNGIDAPESERAICYTWALGKYQSRYGGTFHPSVLAELAKFGYLTKDDSSRGGNRRYYKLTNPAVVAALVT